MGKRKYIFDEHFFDCIDTEDKAYVLGLLFADGYNYEKKNTVVLTLSEKDRDILEKVSLVMGSNRPLYFLNKKKHHKNYTDCYRLDFTSVHLSKRLSEIGCGQTKSLTLKFPSVVPHYFLRHFIRGYFDGDGCICYSEMTRGYFHGIVSFVSTVDFCRHLQKILRLWNVNAQLGGDKRANPNVGVLSFGGRNQIIKLYKILYNKSTIFFQRKRKKFNAFFDASTQYLLSKKATNVYKNTIGSKLPFRVVKTLDYKSVHLGSFNTREEAERTSAEWDKDHKRMVNRL